MDVDERRDRAWQLHNEGLTYREIAAELGVSAQTIHNDMRRGDDEASVPLSRAWLFRDDADDVPLCMFCLGERERRHDRGCPARQAGQVVRLWASSRPVPSSLPRFGQDHRGLPGLPSLRPI